MQGDEAAVGLLQVGDSQHAAILAPGWVRAKGAVASEGATWILNPRPAARIWPLSALCCRDPRVSPQTSAILNQCRSGIVLRPYVRLPWLLVSIAVHGAAVTAAVGFGVYTKRLATQSPARIEVQRQDESAPAPPEELWNPSVTSENIHEDVVLQELSVDIDLFVADPVPPVLDDDRLLPSPSEIMQLANLERVVPAAPESTSVALESEDVPPTEDATKPREEPLPQQWVEAQQHSDNKAPVYPEKERRLKREGKVLLLVSVSAYGLVDSVLLLEPSRYPGFNRAAREAAREWRFMPATQGGVAVASQPKIEVVFRQPDAE